MANISIKYLYPVLFLLLFSSGLKAQEYLMLKTEKQAIQLSGYVLYDTLRAIPFSHVYIKNKPRGTLCDFWGYYNFVVEGGDTIVFSSVGYKKKWVVLPDSVSDNAHTYNCYLPRDTVMLPEALILPWKTFAEFKIAFVKAEVKEDDADRARKNFDWLKKQLEYDDYVVDAKMNYNHFMNQKMDQLYYAGQARPLSIFNIMSWQQFFKAIKNGDFEQGDKPELDYDY